MADQPFLPYGRQSVDADDIEAVLQVLRGDWLTTGPAVDAFESGLSSFTHARHARVVNSGTAALHAAYAAAGLGKGHTIVTSPLTFVATAHCALWMGADVRFADVDPTTGLIGADSAAALIDSSTRLIVPIDYAGHPCDYTALRALAEKSGTTLVADAAHSLGATYEGDPVGTLAHLTATSFHPVKPITSAEGGAVLTDDPELDRRIAQFRNHGMERDPGRLRDQDAGAWAYEVQALGLNYRMPDVLCALGLSQLGKLESFIARRQELAARYARDLEDVGGIDLPPTAANTTPGWHIYVIRVQDAGRRRALFDRLRADGLGVQVHYDPVHLHPFYADRGHRAGECPNAEDFSSRAISIPLYPALADGDVDRVVATIRAAAADLL
tara:strand:- start:12449 stop:13600 length:1152 start_codon:yes stop_codon:yes gene_type:complete